MKDNHFITLPYTLERAAPPFEDNGIVYPASLVRHFLKHYTKKNDKVLDPFAGLGTTLFAAEEMGRIPYGVESERQRFEWTAGQMKHWQHLRHDDSARIARLDLPKMDFCITSPPFMSKDHQWNPLYSGNPAYKGYPAYIARLKHTFSEIAKVMKKGAHVVVQVDNIRGRRAFTPLVHDMAAAIAASLRLDDEKIIRWENGPADYPYTHCLIFKKI